MSPAALPATFAAAGFHSLSLYIRTDMFHINLAVLLALLIATPGLAPLHRLKVTGFALGILFSAHILILLIYVKYIYAVRLGEYSPFVFGPVSRSIYEWSYLFLHAVGWPALPLAIWAAMLVRVFLGRDREGYDKRARER